MIVETREETWRAHGLDAANHEQSIAFCEKLFAKYLDGHRLMSNAAHLRGSAWLNFQRVLCRRWHHGNRVLIGDAAHTAHFSIGSGTKLAMEDAIALVARTAGATDVPGALAAYQEERETEALKLQSAARNRMRWFEDVARYTRLEPWQFTYSLLTGSQRIGHANLRLRDPAFVAGRRGAARGARGHGRRRARRCSCRSSCAACGSRTASSSRRWRSTRPTTACPTTGTSCISARARPAAPGWCSPR